MSILKIVSAAVIAAAIVSAASVTSSNDSESIQKYDLGNGLYIYGEESPNVGEDLCNYSSYVGTDPGNGDGIIID